MTPQILVPGAGHAGLAADGRAAHDIRRDGLDASVTLVDAAPHFVERVRLHQIAAWGVGVVVGSGRCRLRLPVEPDEGADGWSSRRVFRRRRDPFAFGPGPPGRPGRSVRGGGGRSGSSSGALGAARHTVSPGR